MMHNLKNLGGIALAAVVVLSGCDAPVQPPAEPAEDETALSVQTATGVAARGLDLPKPRTREQVTTPLMSASASAANGLTFFTGLASFQEVCSDLPVEDFEEGQSNFAVGFQPPLDEFTNNGIFATGDILPGLSITTNNSFSGTSQDLAFFPPTPPSFGNFTSKVVIANFFVESFIMDFTAGDVTGVGGDLVRFTSGPGTVNIDVFGTSGLLGSTTAANTPAGSFWGVLSDEPITQIEIFDIASGAEGMDNIGFGACVIIVDVDIKPDSDPNSINLTSKGRLPVAILTTDDFDAADVDPSTVTLGDDDGNDTGVAARKNGTLFANLEDVDGDGDLDLILHFDRQALVGNGDLDANTTELTLNGETTGGQAIKGSDSVNIVP